MTWALAGKIAVYWLAAGVFVIVALNRARSIYRAKEARNYYLRILRLEEDRRRREQLQRQRAALIVADAIVDSEYLANARKAESLGFTDDDEYGTAPPRVA